MNKLIVILSIAFFAAGEEEACKSHRECLFSSANTQCCFLKKCHLMTKSEMRDLAKNIRTLDPPLSSSLNEAANRLPQLTENTCHLYVESDERNFREAISGMYG